MGLGTAETRAIERIIHELAHSACCGGPLVIKWLASPAEVVDYLDRLGLDALLDMGATSLWQQGGSSVSPDVKAFDQAFEARLVANELLDVDECDKTLMAPKLLAKSLALSAKLPAHGVFCVRAVLAQIGWLETSVSDAAAQAVFNVELLLRSGASESSVPIDNQLEVFRAYELGLLATWETPDEVICVPSFRA
jgi:hypothetical protein